MMKDIAWRSRAYLIGLSVITLAMIVDMWVMLREISDVPYGQARYPGFAVFVVLGLLIFSSPFLYDLYKGILGAIYK